MSRRDLPLLEARVVYQDEEEPESVRHYVGWGGKDAQLDTDMDMGRGVYRTPQHGLRRAVWDAAFGYVSGFPLRDILWYVMTRSFSPRLAHRVIQWERRNDR